MSSSSSTALRPLEQKFRGAPLKLDILRREGRYSNLRETYSPLGRNYACDQIVPRLDIVINTL